MVEASTSVIDRWETVRYELLKTRVCDLRLRVRGSPVEAFVRRLYHELERKGIRFRPGVYLTDSWGCPDQVPLVGVPFYLADKRLSRLEEEQTGEIEDGSMTMMLLRHEAGHAINYAYRLWEDPEWVRLFGQFSLPYRDRFEPNPYSRQFVRHLHHSQYRWMYAQKHPDEDFAETFAVWLTPRSGWRRRYRNWPVIRKLRLVSRLMTRVRDRRPVRNSGARLNPVRALTLTLAEHYGQRAEQYRASAHGYVDDKLRAVFPDMDEARELDADALVRRNRREILSRVVRWSGMDQEDVERILTKIEDRSRDLGLGLQRNQVRARLLDLTALTTALAMDLGYTGRFCD